MVHSEKPIRRPMEVKKSCVLLPYTECKFKSMTFTDVQPQILRYNYAVYMVQLDQLLFMVISAFYTFLNS